MSIENIRRIKAEANLPKQKARKPIAKKSAKKLRQEKEDAALLKEAREMGKPVDGDKEQWFQDRMRENDPVCWECGFRANWLKLPEYEKIWRACQAHIIPKSKNQFPSVATHPLNHMVLFPSWGGHLCGHHGEYDSSWFNATTMKVWPKAVERFKQFELSIAHNERRKLPEQLLQYLNTDQ